MGMLRASCDNRFRWLSLYFTLVPAEMCRSSLVWLLNACLRKVKEVVLGFCNDFLRGIMLSVGCIEDFLNVASIYGFKHQFSSQTCFCVRTCRSVYSCERVRILTVFAVEDAACINYVLSGSFNRLVLYRQGFAKVGVKLYGIVYKGGFAFPDRLEYYFHLRCGVESVVFAMTGAFSTCAFASAAPTVLLFFHNNFFFQDWIKAGGGASPSRRDSSS